MTLQCDCANCQRSRDPHWGYMPYMRTAKMPPSPPKSRVIVDSNPLVLVPMLLITIVSVIVTLCVVEVFIHPIL